MVAEGELVCRHCGQPGHRRSNCPELGHMNVHGDDAENPHSDPESGEGEVNEVCLTGTGSPRFKGGLLPRGIAAARTHHFPGHFRTVKRCATGMLQCSSAQG